MKLIRTLKIIFLISCFIISPALAGKKTQWEMTTLDNWQEANIVALVEVDSFINIPEKNLSFTKLKVKELWGKKSKLQSHVFYILNSYNPEDIGKRFIGAYSKTALIRHLYEKSLNKHLNTTNNIYLQSRFELNKWPVLKDTSGKTYISGCIDGFTKKPLIDPSLEQLKNLALPVIDKKTTRIRPKLCKDTKKIRYIYMFLRFLKSFVSDL